MRWSRRARASWAGAIVSLLAFIATAPAYADHPGPLRSEGWTPLTAAVVFGGLALLAGMLVIVIVTLLMRRDDGSS
jgi:hypothetical protein